MSELEIDIINARCEQAACSFGLWIAKCIRENIISPTNAAFADEDAWYLLCQLVSTKELYEVFLAEYNK